MLAIGLIKMVKHDLPLMSGRLLIRVCRIYYLVLEACYVEIHVQLDDKSLGINNIYLCNHQNTR